MRPALSLLSDDTVEEIVVTALQVLEKIGIEFENPNAVAILEEKGIPFEEGRAKIPEDIVRACIKQAPSKFHLFDRDGNLAARLEGDEVCFDPGSAALNILDPDGTIRKPVTEDLVKFSRLVNELPNFGSQSTGLISSDVPEGMDDWYRLLIALLYCKKPVVTGTFAVESFAIMKDMLVAIRGDEDSLKAKPLAIFDACPSPPFKWSNLTSQSVIDSARLGIPSEFISMPMMGATGPATLRGAVVQHAAETIAGIVLAQSTVPGAPIVYGGSPSVFDMRQGTTPMGAIETMMIDCAYAQVGKSFGLPTHAYMGLSDSKLVDSQAGLESGIGAILAALEGINMISGPGMLDFESCQSLEKLVIDNEIAGMALRLVDGIKTREENLLEVFSDLVSSESLLSHPHTLKWFRKEFFFPSAAINRAASKESIDAKVRAKKRVNQILDTKKPELPPNDVTQNLYRLATEKAKSFGLAELPLKL
ncbi:MAG: trimethylamine methyltransferase family protein [Candidatus Hodarchaeales archaeon]|jgi:trimethylamine--corrinoid protein Co-methyltransferase